MFGEFFIAKLVKLTEKDQLAPLIGECSERVHERRVKLKAELLPLTERRRCPDFFRCREEIEKAQRIILISLKWPGERDLPLLLLLIG